MKCSREIINLINSSMACLYNSIPTLEVYEEEDGLYAVKPVDQLKSDDNEYKFILSNGCWLEFSYETDIDNMPDEDLDDPQKLYDSMALQEWFLYSPDGSLVVIEDDDLFYDTLEKIEEAIENSVFASDELASICY